MIIDLLLLILGFTLLISGANYLVKGASNIAKKFHIPEILIGLTIVSLGTTLPELVVSIVSATTGSTDIVLGNVIGSNLCNLLLILGTITVLKPIKFEKITLNRNIPLLIFLTSIILIMGMGFLKDTKLVINKIDGFILLGIALVYFSLPVIQFFKERDEEKEFSENDKEKTFYFITKNIIYIILGGLALKFGGDFAVNSATAIAQTFGISERVIGLTIVAIGTSLPELITSVVAILKGNDDIAEGNIIGACIINSCLVLGSSAVISNLPISASYIEDLLLLLGCISLIWLFGFENKENIFKRRNGVILLIIYAVYTIKLFI